MNAKQLDETPAPYFQPLAQQRDTAQPQIPAGGFRNANEALSHCIIQRDQLAAETKSLADQVREFHAKAAHAERLAEALKDTESEIRAWFMSMSAKEIRDSFWSMELSARKARKALAQWKEVQP